MLEIVPSVIEILLNLCLNLFNGRSFKGADAYIDEVDEGYFSSKF